MTGNTAAPCSDRRQVWTLYDYRRQRRSACSPTLVADESLEPHITTLVNEELPPSLQEYDKSVDDDNDERYECLLQSPPVMHTLESDAGTIELDTNCSSLLEPLMKSREYEGHGGNTIVPHTQDILRKRRRRRGLQRQMMTLSLSAEYAAACGRQTDARTLSAGSSHYLEEYPPETDDLLEGSQRHQSLKVLKTVGSVLLDHQRAVDSNPDPADEGSDDWSCDSDYESLSQLAHDKYTGRHTPWQDRETSLERESLSSRQNTASSPQDYITLRNDQCADRHQAPEKLRGSAASELNDLLGLAPSSEQTREGIQAEVLNVARLDIISETMPRSTIHNSRYLPVFFNASSELTYQHPQQQQQQQQQQPTSDVGPAIRSAVAARITLPHLTSSALLSRSSVSASAATLTIPAVTAIISADTTRSTQPETIPSSGLIDQDGQSVRSSSDRGAWATFAHILSESDGTRSVHHSRYSHFGIHAVLKEEVSEQEHQRGLDRSNSDNDDETENGRPPHVALREQQQQPLPTSRTPTQRPQPAVMSREPSGSIPMSRRPPTLPTTPSLNEPIAHQIRRVHSAHNMNLRRQWEQQQQRHQRPNHFPESVLMSRHHTIHLPPLQYPASFISSSSDQDGQSDIAMSRSSRIVHSLNIESLPLPYPFANHPIASIAPTVAPLTSTTTGDSAGDDNLNSSMGLNPNSIDSHSSNSWIMSSNMDTTSSPPFPTAYLLSSFSPPPPPSSPSLSFFYPPTHLPPTPLPFTSPSSSTSPYFHTSSNPVSPTFVPLTTPEITRSLTDEEQALPNERYWRTRSSGDNSLYSNYEGGTLRPEEEWRRGDEDIVGR